MNKKNNRQLSLLLLTLASGLTGTLWTLIPDINDIRFFTLEGNSICSILLASDLFYLLSGKKFPKAMGTLEYVFMVSILTIGIAYCTLLTDFFSIEFWQNTRTVFLHFLTPLLFTLYVLVYRRYSLPGIKQSAWALLPPLLYGAFVVIRHYVFVETLHLVPRWFPYFFMDIDKLGLDGFAVWVAAMAAAIYLIGFLILLLAGPKKR